MSDVGPEGRSYEAIKDRDLDRLAQIALADRTHFFARHAEWASLYADRHFATALCQGGALHYVYGEAGIQDFDVYSFYASHPLKEWYAKRRKIEDFGDPKFGQSLDKPKFIGRRVDLLGRSIDRNVHESSSCAIRRWLLAGRTETARLLAQKAMVLIDPIDERGTVIWP